MIGVGEDAEGPRFEIEDYVLGVDIEPFTGWRPGTGESVSDYAARVVHSRSPCRCGRKTSVLALDCRDILSGHGVPDVRCRICWTVRPHLRDRSGKARPEPTHGIYFIESGAGGPIKIGWSKESAAARLLALQTGNPERLRLLGVVPGRVVDERRLHAVLREHVILGEWFRREPALRVLERMRRGEHLDKGR